MSEVNHNKVVIFDEIDSVIKHKLKAADIVSRLFEKNNNFSVYLYRNNDTALTEGLSWLDYYISIES